MIKYGVLTNYTPFIFHMWIAYKQSVCKQESITLPLSKRDPDHISSMPDYNYFSELLLISHHVWSSRFPNKQACQKVGHIEADLYFSPWEMWRLGCETDSVCSGTSQWHLPSNPPTRQLGSAVSFKQIRASGGGKSAAFSWLTTYQ